MRARFIRTLVPALTMLFLSCAGDPTPPQDAQIVFHNQSTVAMTEARFSDCDDLSGFGPNRLQSALAGGSQIAFSTAAGCYDLMAVFQDGREKIEWAVEVGAGQTRTWYASP